MDVAVETYVGVITFLFGSMAKGSKWCFLCREGRPLVSVEERVRIRGGSTVSGLLSAGTVLHHVQLCSGLLQWHEIYCINGAMSDNIPGLGQEWA